MLMGYFLQTQGMVVVLLSGDAQKKIVEGWFVIPATVISIIAALIVEKRKSRMGPKHEI